MRALIIYHTFIYYMQKVFAGEVIESRSFSFPDKTTNELITLWKITLAVSDTNYITFHISEQNQDLFYSAEQLQKGDQIQLTAEATPGKEGNIRWKPLKIQLSEKNEA